MRRVCANQLKRDIKNLARRNLSDSVGKPDRLGNLRIAEPGLSRLRDVMFDARHTVAAHGGTQRHKLAITSAKMRHETLLR